MTDEAVTLGKLIIPPKVYALVECLAVQLFIELGIHSVPIDPFYIARQKGYVLVPFSSLTPAALLELKLKKIDGASCRRKCDGRYYIFYDDSASYVRQRFTIMHEIGHILLNHKEDSELAERLANHFAGYALAPTPLIGLYGCEDYIETAELFGVSEESAAYRISAFNHWNGFSWHRDYDDKLLCMFEKKEYTGGDARWLF
jgi:hypothetical protein